MTDALAAAYSSTGGAWQRGPGRIYDRLAQVLIARTPLDVNGARAVDVGAGTGAAGRALLQAGAVGVVAVDLAAGMLAHDAAHRPPAAVGDARSLPFPAGAFDLAVAAFCLNHLTDPSGGLREMARVTRRGGGVLAATYAADDTHPVKTAVERALAARGWQPPDWYAAIQTAAVPLLATAALAEAALHAAGLASAEVESRRVAFGDLRARDLVEWRLGMAHHAPFVSTLDEDARAGLVEDAVAWLGEGPPLVRSILVLRAIKP